MIMKHSKDRLYEVLFCDDEAEQRTKFMQKHANSAFHVTTEGEIESLPRKLASLHRLPDLVVLDLFHPIDSSDPAELARENAKIAERVAEINTAMDRLCREGDYFFKPKAISVLREIRSMPRLADLPVLLYTRYGVSTVNEEEMKEAIELCADWMLKGRTAQTEQRMMYSVISKGERSASIARDIRLGAIFTIIGAILAWLLCKL